MMKSIYKVFTFLSLTLLMATLPACTDDRDDFFNNGAGNLEGECEVSFDLQGMPLADAMTRTAGDAIKSVRNLYVFFYNAEGDGELAYAFTSDAGCANDVFRRNLTLSAENVDRNDFNPGSSEWQGTGESATQKVSTSQVRVDRGKYYVYAVANVDDFSAADFSAEDVKTPELLRKYQLRWNASNIAANDAMFGFFTTESDAGYDVINEDAPVVTLATNNQTLHAWVKRAVSKVTVAFDGSQLHDNVNVYIKKVSIKDIPLNCNLGSTNTPTSMQQLITYGEEIVYNNTTGISNATRISSREPYFPNFTSTTDDDEAVAQWKKDVHSQTTNALYFFENCQGKATGEVDKNGSWKQQTDIDGNGIPDDRDNGIQKDTKAYGTYIEVEAYYTNDNFGSQTKGKIVYRFMLGMNTTNDFNSHRNNHYKLTLCLKNNANDVDWHVDYSDEPGIYIPDTIYVSYTYNTPTILPIRIVGHNVQDLNVEITQANWNPDDSTIPQFRGTTDPAGLATGFLSLTFDDSPRIRDNEVFGTGDQDRVKQYWDNGNPNNVKRNYINNGSKRAWADLDPHGYNVQNRRTSEGYNVFEADIPLFTRPLVIYKWAAWSGANPYFSSPRSGKIRVTYTVDGKTEYKDVNVIQVRRVENPTGIYRRHDNDEKFDVVLLERNGEGGTHSTPVNYIHFKSVGAWRAIIYRSTTGGGNDAAAWFTLSAGSQRVSRTGAYIQGDDDSEIAFTYKPNGTIPQNSVRCGIIKVEYNDYTCTHYIFVRQGYAPMKLEDSGSLYWHTFNMYSGTQETNHPCEGGSLFVRGRWAPAILDSNTSGFGQAVTSLQALTDENGTIGTVSVPIANSGNTARQNFPNNGSRTLSRNNTALNPWTQGRVPDVTEWATLLNENANAWVNRAFGVLYGDGATTTQTNPEQVYGCLHNDVTTGRTVKGMRGAFVYNTDNGRNLFFPIGAKGYGRRKVGAGGQLQYGFGDNYSTLEIDQPRRALLYHLYTNEGAIYWGARENAATAASNNKKSNAWDINYKTYDFDYMDAAENVTAATLIRLVQDTPP